MQATWLEGRAVLAVGSAVLGILTTLLVQRLLGKRGVFNYFVRHDRVAASAHDALIGSIEVLWNGNPVKVLYATTIELVNASLQDYEDVVATVYTGDTIILSERTEFAGSLEWPRWTDAYSAFLTVPTGQKATSAQIDTYSRRREYLLKTMNRGQIARFSFLVTTDADHEPRVWLDILHKGIKLNHRIKPVETMGVPQPMAAAVGVASGLVLLVGSLAFLDSVWIAAPLMFVYGLIAQAPGAGLVHAYRWMRSVLAD